MDFFEHQERARRHTTFLVFLYCVAVAALILLTFFVVAVSVTMARGPTISSRYVGSSPHLIELLHLYPQLFLLSAIGTLTVIGLGTLYKLSTLSQGGRVVAETLAGRELGSGTDDLTEQKLLNIVQEMSLAAGVPTPPVFLLDHEESINAFAAGFSIHDAVIGVSRGAAQQLTREELQGVIGHEFSHILNGDMRLNLRLIGTLHGILMIALVGRVLLELANNASRYRSRNEKSPAAVFFFAGISLYAIGYAGVVCGRLIKAAVSRQREFLADASAVQFTRNPAGIAGALRKIGGLAGSRMQHPRAEEVSHLYFAEGCSYFFAFAFATHPPLKERIARIEGRRTEFSKELPASPATEDTATPGLSRFATGAASVVTRVGTVEEVDVQRAQDFAHTLPLALNQALLSVDEAVALTLGLASCGQGAKTISDSTNGGEASVPLGPVPSAADGQFNPESKKVVAYADSCSKLSVNERFMLLSRCAAALHKLAPENYRALRRQIVALVRSDGFVSITEYAFISVLFHSLDAHILRTPPLTVRYHDLVSLLPFIEVVLSTLAYHGVEQGSRPEHPTVQAAFAAAQKTLGAPLTLRPFEEASVSQFDGALRELARAAPALKRLVVEAAVACVQRDGRITTDEGALLRALCASIGAPLPAATF